MDEASDLRSPETFGLKLDFIRPYNGALIVKLFGTWKVGSQLPTFNEFNNELEKDPPIQKISFDSVGLGHWDTGLISYLLKAVNYCEMKHIELATDGLPEGVINLLNLASAAPERIETRKDLAHPSIITSMGDRVTKVWKSTMEIIAFVGEILVAFLKLFTGRARFRWSDLLLIIQESGAQALPIVSLISLLVGLILAFVGSIQLKMFGAQIYIANLVAIAMARAMGAIMTGIIMAGRTGASFAAGIGSMQVNEEIDALKTAGLPPMEFLVLPRIIALAIMMPLLTLYADLMGMLGGMIVAVGGFDIGFQEYFNATKDALTLTTIAIGLFSSFIFGILVAIAGCLRGMQCGRSASAVGDATTSAVVTSIVSIIVATAIITIGCNILGI
jgi:phospholipid/cholesterol/gamma-HCH transport system permease protein